MLIFKDKRVACAMLAGAAIIGSAGLSYYLSDGESQSIGPVKRDA